MVADRKRWSSLQLVALPVLTRRVWGGKLVLATRQIKCCWIFGSYREACQLCQKHWQWATYHFHIFSPFEVIAKSGILSFQPKIKGNPVQCIYVTNRVKLPWKKIGLLTVRAPAVMTLRNKAWMNNTTHKNTETCILFLYHIHRL